MSTLSRAISAAIRRNVPVRTFDRWDDPAPGFDEDRTQAAEQEALDPEPYGPSRHIANPFVCCGGQPVAFDYVGREPQRRRMMKISFRVPILSGALGPALACPPSVLVAGQATSGPAPGSPSAPAGAVPKLVSDRRGALAPERPPLQKSEVLGRGTSRHANDRRSFRKAITFANRLR